MSDDLRLQVATVVVGLAAMIAFIPLVDNDPGGALFVFILGLFVAGVIAAWPVIDGYLEKERQESREEREHRRAMEREAHTTSQSILLVQALAASKTATANTEGFWNNHMEQMRLAQESSVAFDDNRTRSYIASVAALEKFMSRQIDVMESMHNRSMDEPRIMRQQALDVIQTLSGVQLEAIKFQREHPTQAALVSEALEETRLLSDAAELLRDDNLTKEEQNRRYNRFIERMSKSLGK